MSRPQSTTVSATESPAVVRTGTRSNPATIDAQSGARLTGKCKLCAQPMKLLESGFWVHEGTGYAVHSLMVEAHRKALVA